MIHFFLFYINVFPVKSIKNDHLNKILFWKIYDINLYESFFEKPFLNLTKLGLSRLELCVCDCDCFELCSVHDQLFRLHSSSTGWHDIEWAGKLKYVSEFSYNGVLLNWKRKSLQVFLWIWMPCPPTEKTYNELGLQFFNSNVCNPIYYSASYHLYCISYFITVVLLHLFVFYLKTLWNCNSGDTHTQFSSLWREQKEQKEYRVK